MFKTNSMAAVFIALGAMSLTREHERQRREQEEQQRQQRQRYQKEQEQHRQHAIEARTIANGIRIADYRAKITQIERLTTSTPFEEDLKRNCRHCFDVIIAYNENSHEAYADVDATLAFLQLAPKTIESLIQAITKGHTGVIRFILKSKAVAVVANADVFQTTNVDIVRLLIDYGFDPCANENAAIKFAITHGASDVVHLLVQNERCRDPELLSLAIQQKNPWILGALLSHIDPTEKAFHLAVEFAKNGFWQSTQCLNLFFRHPRLHVTDFTDCLPLILTNNSILKAICLNPVRTAFIQEVLLFLCKSPLSLLSQVQYILCAESNCRIYVKTFKQAVEIACEHNNPHILECLLRCSGSASVGLDIKRMFKSACANGKLSIVKVLLPAVVNDKETLIAAKQDARRAGHTEICALIRTPWWCACVG
jgi:hypothetical protein